MSTRITAEEAQEVRRYREDLAHFKRRTRAAFVVRVVTTVVAVLMLAWGAALTLGSFTTLPGEYLVDRFIPGADGSISPTHDGRYVITRPDGDLPACTVTDQEGGDVPLEAFESPGNPPLPTHLFHATAGSYHVACEGGNDGVAVFRLSELDVVQNRLDVMVRQALPFLATGLLLFFGGKWAARRIAPERLRPVVPSSLQ